MCNHGQAEEIEEQMRDKVRRQEDLEAQVKKAEDMLRKERSQFETELAALTSERDTVMQSIDSVKESLSATADAAKDLDASSLTRLLEEYERTPFCCDYH